MTMPLPDYTEADIPFEEPARHDADAYDRARDDRLDFPPDDWEQREADERAIGNDPSAEPRAHMRRTFNLTAKGECECRVCGTRENVQAHHAIPTAIGTADVTALIAWFLVGLLSVVGYTVAASLGASLWEIWPLLVLILASVFALLSYGVRS